jgi:hypothetical protein
MSGQGLISIRIPRSLLGAFRLAAERKGLTVHDAARFIISALPSVTPDDLAALREPPDELDAPRVSLYIGWRSVDVLARAIDQTSLTNSTVLRRLLFALLVTKEIGFVQQDSYWKLQMNPAKHISKTNS